MEGVERNLTFNPGWREELGAVDSKDNYRTKQGQRLILSFVLVLTADSFAGLLF